MTGIVNQCGMGCQQQGSEDVRWLRMSPRPLSLSCGVCVQNFQNNWYQEEEFWQWLPAFMEKKKISSFLSLHVYTHGTTTGCSLWVPTTHLARCSSPLWPLPRHRGWEENLARVLSQISLAHYGNAHSRVFTLSNLTCPGYLCPAPSGGFHWLQKDSWSFICGLS